MSESLQPCFLNKAIRYVLISSFILLIVLSFSSITRLKILSFLRFVYNFHPDSAARTENIKITVPQVPNNPTNVSINERIASINFEYFSIRIQL
jgi:hypothetical protein